MKKLVIILFSIAINNVAHAQYINHLDSPTAQNWGANVLQPNYNPRPMIDPEPAQIRPIAPPIEVPRQTFCHETMSGTIVCN